MAKRKLSGSSIRKLIEQDDRRKLIEERKRFMNWWRTLDNKLEMSLLKAAWEAWKARAGVKA